MFPASAAFLPGCRRLGRHLPVVSLEPKGGTLLGEAETAPSASLKINGASV